MVIPMVFDEEYVADCKTWKFFHVTNKRAFPTDPVVQQCMRRVILLDGKKYNDYFSSA